MKTTTEPGSRESESQERAPAAQTGTQRADQAFDPDFPIAVEGGPTDSGGDPHAGPAPPPKG